jgi:hypothetical protein
MMRGYSDVQRSFTQYAVASLVLPLTFLRDLLGIPKEVALAGYIDSWLWIGWVGLLLTILFSLAYQTIAARRIAEVTGGAPFLFTYPRFWFISSTTAFFVGITCLFIGVVRAPGANKPVAPDTITISHRDIEKEAARRASIYQVLRQSEEARRILGEHKAGRLSTEQTRASLQALIPQNLGSLPPFAELGQWQ